MINFKTYDNDMLAHALSDCYATLEAGQYAADHPYARKLCALIEAIRDVQMSRRRRTGSAYDYTPSWHTRSNGQPLDTEA